MEGPPISAAIVADLPMDKVWSAWFLKLWLNANRQSGTTANRPTTNLFPGRPYFDETLGIPIWFKTGSTWVNASGVAV